MGLFVGFDIIGPISMAAFGVAITALAAGNAQLMTIYGACFVTVGWVPLMTVLLSKITKKGGKPDTDDFNLSVSGPINAFFENIKLTVAFSMPYAYRSPLTVIPGLMVGSAATGLITALCGIVNNAYLTELPKYGNGETFTEMFQRGVKYTFPLRCRFAPANGFPAAFRCSLSFWRVRLSAGLRCSGLRSLLTAAR